MLRSSGGCLISEIRAGGKGGQDIVAMKIRIGGPLRLLTKNIMKI